MHTRTSEVLNQLYVCYEPVDLFFGFYNLKVFLQREDEDSNIEGETICTHRLSSKSYKDTRFDDLVLFVLLNQ